MLRTHQMMMICWWEESRQNTEREGGVIAREPTVEHVTTPRVERAELGGEGCCAFGDGVAEEENLRWEFGCWGGVGW